LYAYSRVPDVETSVSPAMVVADPQVIAGGPAQAGAAIDAAINDADATAAERAAGFGTKRGNTRILDTASLDRRRASLRMGALPWSYVILRRPEAWPWSRLASDR
jgi:hypothetical protein